MATLVITNVPIHNIKNTTKFWLNEKKRNHGSTTKFGTHQSDFKSKLFSIQWEGFKTHKGKAISSPIPSTFDEI